MAVSGLAAPDVLACAVLVGWAVLLSAIDFRERRLPNTLTLTGAAAILTGAAVCGRWSAALLGGVALAGLYLVVHLAAPAAMGAGDVKLALGLGALTGSFGVGVWALAAIGASLFTALLGTVSVARGRGGTVPHGPSMCAASLAAAALAALPDSVHIADWV